MTVAAAVAGLAGLLFGSFANVIVHRVPRKESLVRPRSRCPACGARIRAADNVPVVSWILLRGRCRHCGAPIAWRYPLVEALTAVLFALAVLRIPDGDHPAHTQWDLLAYLPFLFVLVPLSFIDLEHKILPNRIVLPAIGAGATLFGVAAAAGPGLDAWLRALGGGAVGFAAFLALAIVSPRGMGMGDVKLAALLGLGLGYLGWAHVFLGFFLSFVVGSVAGLALIAARRAGMKSQVPFGPWLAIGTVVAVLVGSPLVDAWLRR